MYRSIVVPLDGSPFGEQALAPALRIARRSAANLQLVHVHVPLADIYTEPIPGLENTVNPAFRRRGQAYLEAVVAQLQPTAGEDLAVSGVLLEGTVPEAIQEHVARTRAELVVMTTHGRGLIARAWLGGVADALIHRLNIPLFLVRPREVGAGSAAESPLRHVLIPLDGTPLAEDIVEPAVALGGLTGADYTLLRVIRPMLPASFGTAYPTGVGYEELLEQLQELDVQERTEAEGYLEHLAEGLRVRGLTVTTRVAVHEQPAVAILEEAKAHPDGFVALATHARSGLPRLFLGSVADKVLRGGVVPVFVHRAAPVATAGRGNHRGSTIAV